MDYLFPDGEDPRPYKLYVGTVYGKETMCREMLCPHQRGILRVLQQEGYSLFTVFTRTFDEKTIQESRDKATALEGAIQVG